MKVEIWSDVVCPWCYIGKRRFEAALARFPQRDQVEVEWQSFELDPGARSAASGSAADRSGYADLLARKYGTTRAAAQQMLESTAATAAGEGLEFHFERAVPAGTFDAHRVIHLAAERGIQGAVKERLFRAHFTEGEVLDDRETLVRLGAEAGLDAGEVRSVLGSARYADEVRADEAEAAAIGITGVPFFVIDRKYGVSGAQPAGQLLRVLQQVWAESNPLVVVGTGDDAAACGPDGCAV